METPKLKEAPRHKPVVALVDASTGQRYDLGDAPLVIGRKRTCDVQLKERFASGVHCSVTPQAEGHALVADLGSTNGTVVNGVPLEGKALSLRPGSQLVIGWTCLVAVGADGHVPIFARTPSSLMAKSVPIYGSSRAAARKLGKSDRTIRRARDKKAAHLATDKDNRQKQ